MSLRELQNWLLEEGVGPELAQLARLSAASAFPKLEWNSDVAQFEPDWPRLLLAASFLSQSDERKAQEAALRVASAGLVVGQSDVIKDASAILMRQLANQRSVELAERRDVLRSGMEGRLGVFARIAAARHKMDSMVLLRSGEWLQVNRFQKAFWNGVAEAAWVSTSAPTSAGKTYVVLRWLLDRLASGEVRLAVYLAPTRALVAEVEEEIRGLAPRHNLEDLQISPLPVKELHESAAAGNRVVFVLTQERLHLLANAVDDRLAIDLLVVDEAHKIGDHLRGVVLQDAIERITRVNPNVGVVFVSPSTENPATLLDDAPSEVSRAPIDSEAPTVTQNLITATQVSGDSRSWEFSLRYGESEFVLGKIRLPNRPVGTTKRLAFVAAAAGGLGGTLVYANGAADAEKIALLISGTISPKPDESAEAELAELADLARRGVHPEYALAMLARRGIAFHYGNMPSLLRSEVERLFRLGKIRFLVCTSTLMEGVNLACRTIVLRGPRKGRGNPMEAHDFWNLAGRAGRWGHDLQGNIVCVDTTDSRVWPNGLPRRTRFSIKRETDAVLSRAEELIAYVLGRWVLEPAALAKSPDLEQVSAYLLALRLREGSILAAPWATRYKKEVLQPLDEALGMLAERIEIPAETASRHPGVSACGMQKLLEHFRSRKGRPEELPPSAPESDDAWQRLIMIFHRINRTMYPAFWPTMRVPIHALVTLEWMRGHSLPSIIQKCVQYQYDKGRPVRLPALIRETMQHVGETARFAAPKIFVLLLRYS